MTPKEFIAQKKTEFTTVNFNEPFFKSDLFKSHIEEGENIEELKEKIKKTDYAVYLFESNRHRFPPHIVELYDSGNLAIGEIENPTPNAHFRILGDLKYAITFNAGLKNFIYRVIRAYSTRFVFTEDKEVNSIPLEETCQKIADIFWWFRISQGQAYGPNYPITEDQIHIANIITTEAELFFLAHEVGHLSIDLIDKSPFAKDYNTKYGHISEELEADRFALLTCMGSFNEKDNTQTSRNDVIYASCELALMIFDGLKKLGFETEKTHPSANERIEHLRKCLRQSCSNDSDYHSLTKFAEVTSEIYNKVITLISQPSGIQEKYFNEKANKIINQISNLLDKCSNGRVPDYSTFNIEMSQFFESGYHHKIIDKIFEVGQLFFQGIVKHKDNSNLFDNEAIKNFFKFKLLLSFTEKLPEPAKGLFQQKLFEANTMKH